MKAILIPVLGADDLPAVLPTALLAGRRFGSYLEGLELYPARPEQLVPAGLVNGLLFDSFEEKQREYRRRAQERFTVYMRGEWRGRALARRRAAEQRPDRRLWPALRSPRAGAALGTWCGRPHGAPRDGALRERPAHPDRPAGAAGLPRPRRRDRLEWQHRDGAHLGLRHPLPAPGRAGGGADGRGCEVPDAPRAGGVVHYLACHGIEATAT